MKSFSSIFILSMPVWLTYLALISLRQQQLVTLSETASLFNGLYVSDQGDINTSCNGIWSCSSLIENSSDMLQIKAIGPPIGQYNELFEVFGERLRFDTVNIPMSYAFVINLVVITIVLLSAIWPNSRLYYCYIITLLGLIFFVHLSYIRWGNYLNTLYSITNDKPPLDIIAMNGVLNIYVGLLLLIFSMCSIVHVLNKFVKRSLDEQGLYDIPLTSNI